MPVIRGLKNLVSWKYFKPPACESTTVTQDLAHQLSCHSRRVLIPKSLEPPASPTYRPILTVVIHLCEHGQPYYSWTHSGSTVAVFADQLQPL
jgi:hypothetical protein